ncbi:hypothetical protein GOP47_0000595 [Adiantum capillus-veneris]|uniref:PX domain-containing protein n=1 Tax=Adiantum capillus-veneris TaxID=13818 RepID=A0A9D4VF15_ADICA|nr:hypothetical protein GOP47_0000595 [Adiantum capillus-veneris]
MAGKSFTRHRHDGTSPLPLGMDYSPAPSRWTGPNTSWPHDPRTGWSYCVMIPSWTMLSDAKTGDTHLASPIVFYRVQVGIQSPQGVSTLRKVLRRFSDFLKLHASLKKAFPKKSLPLAPPKNSMLWMKANDTYLEERRLSLVDWLSKLFADIEISRSAPVAAFFELEASARAAMAMIKEAQLSTPLFSDPRFMTGASSGTSVTSETEQGSDASCDLYVPEILSGTSKAGVDFEIDDLEESTGTGQQELLNRELDAIESDIKVNASDLQENFSFKDAKLTFGQKLRPVSSVVEEGRSGHERKLSIESIASEMSSARGSDISFAATGDGHSENSQWDILENSRSQNLNSFDAEMLKGVQAALPMDQRGNVRRLLANLNRRMINARADMEDLTTRLTQESIVKEFLSAKVRDLEGELDSTRRKSKETLHQALSMEQDNINNLQWELAEARASLVNADEQTRQQQEARALAEEKLKVVEMERDKANLEILELKSKLQNLHKEKEGAEIKTRNEMKILAREIKTLRKSQPELKEDLEVALKDKAKLEVLIQNETQKQEKRRAERTKFLHEVASLRKRLQECSIEFLAKQDDKTTVKNAVVRDVMDFLMTSDNRIGLLAAEVQLLAEEKDEDKAIYQSFGREGLPNGVLSSNSNSKVQDDELQSERAFRKLLSEIFMDNVQLYKVVNSMTLNAAVMDAKPDSSGQDVTPTKKNISMLSRFL